MDEEIQKIKEKLDDFERRLKILEEKEPAVEPKKRVEESKKYKGLVGGLRYLIDHDFFKEPKTVKETMEELSKEGYHYPHASISKMLSVDFTKNSKILTRIIEKDVYKYVIRK
jgi:hypothetical protein